MKWDGEVKRENSNEKAISFPVETSLCLRSKRCWSLCSNFTTLIFAIAVCAGVVPIVKSHELSIVVGTGSKIRKLKNKLLEREEKRDRESKVEFSL